MQINQVNSKQYKSKSTLKNIYTTLKAFKNKFTRNLYTKRTLAKSEAIFKCYLSYHNKSEKLCKSAKKRKKVTSKEKKQSLNIRTFYDRMLRNFPVVAL